LYAECRGTPCITTFSSYTYSFHFQLTWPNCPVVLKVTMCTWLQTRLICLPNPPRLTYISIPTIFTMEQCTLKNVNNYLNTNIYSDLDICGSQSYDLYSNVVTFSRPVLIRYLLKTVVFLCWCLIHALLLRYNHENLNTKSK
jgi:hypothetical protein